MIRPYFESHAYRSTLFVIFTALVLIMSIVEISVEFAEGEPFADMADDLLIFLFSAVVLLVVCYDYWCQQRNLRDLNIQLASMRGRLDSESRSIANQYRTVIEKQFEAWKLTPSEKEVALTLIKGLSFREVAEVRQTREKTVRQQATNVYKKAGLSGRHELAGWFFEDLLEPIEPSE